jgi:hypothetical protein
MKRIVLFLALLSCANVFAQNVIVRTPATSKGLWCDLITLRAKVLAETGKALPYSAYLESKTMGFFKDSLSLVSGVGDSLIYQDGVITYQSKKLEIRCDVATNTLVTSSGSIDPQYAYFVPGVEPCICNQQTIVVSKTAKSPFTNATLSTQNTTTDTTTTTHHPHAKQAKNTDLDEPSFSEMYDEEYNDPCHPKPLRANCYIADDSRVGKQLQLGCMNIESKLSLFSESYLDSVQQSWWARCLPIIERSFTERASDSFPEVARMLLCDDDLKHFVIRHIHDGTYLISRKNVDKNYISVEGNGYTVTYLVPNGYSIKYDLGADTTALRAARLLNKETGKEFRVLRLVEIPEGEYHDFSRKMLVARDGFIKTVSVYEDKSYVVSMKLDPIAKVVTISDSKGKIFSSRDLSKKEVHKTKHTLNRRSGHVDSLLVGLVQISP